MCVRHAVVFQYAIDIPVLRPSEILRGRASPPFHARFHLNLFAGYGFLKTENCTDFKNNLAQLRRISRVIYVKFSRFMDVAMLVSFA